MKPGTIYQIDEAVASDIRYMIIKDAGIETNHGKEVISIKFKAISPNMKMDTNWGTNLVQMPLDDFIKFISKRQVWLINDSTRAKMLLLGLEI